MVIDNPCREAHDFKKHPLTFRFQALKAMRDIIHDIEVIIDGIADTSGYIMDFTDVDTGAVNEIFTQTGQFIITGYKIKVEGDHPAVGVSFVQTAGGSLSMKAGKLAKNSSSELIGVFPGCPNGSYKIVIATQFSGGGNTLKAPRFIESPFVLTKV